MNSLRHKSLRHCWQTKWVPWDRSPWDSSHWDRSPWDRSPWDRRPWDISWQTKVLPWDRDPWDFCRQTKWIPWDISPWDICWQTKWVPWDRCPWDRCPWDISWETKWIFWEFWHLFQQTICPLKNYALRHIVHRNKFLKLLSLWYLILDGICRSLWIFGQLLLIGNYLLEKMWNGTQLHYQWSEQPTKNLSKDQRNLQWPS